MVSAARATAMNMSYLLFPPPRGDSRSRLRPQASKVGGKIRAGIRLVKEPDSRPTMLRHGH